jgi:hypothetical protein
MLKRIIRGLSQYQSPQSFSDFNAKSIPLTEQKPEISLESMNRKALSFRKMELEDYDFVSQTSDFDTERFNFKEYLWSCAFYREKSFVRLAAFMFIWSVIMLLSRVVSLGLRQLIVWISPIGYFGMLEPAFKDIELERYRQRLKLSVLHNYD